MKKTLVASCLAAGVTVVGLAAPAAADPTDVYPAPLNGSGSDTTEVVMRQLDAAIGDLASWDIAGGAWDTNGTAAGCAFTGRIAGSTDGRRALANSVTNGDGCFQFARSSSRATSQATANLAALPYNAPTATVSMLPIQLGVDGLGYVFRAGSGTPRDLTLGQLRAIYNCTFTGVVDGRNMASSTIPNQPLLPTDASGTRSDWLALMGLSTSQSVDVASDSAPGATTHPACIEDGPGDSGQAGGEFSEHNGTVLTNGRQIIGHSIGQWIAQGRSFTGDFRGLAQLGYINGNVPLQQLDDPGSNLGPSTASGSPTTDGAYFRNVFNIVPATEWDDPTIQGVFGVRSGGANTDPAGDVPNANSGAICTNDTLVRNNGFIPVC
ncbi:MAG TPA: hypothetical protein VNU26_07310 [Mycobacteriales bacterium]|nr:hypothetical protein [Mycobacteriales bacterium]